MNRSFKVKITVESGDMKLLAHWLRCMAEDVDKGVIVNGAGMIPKLSYYIELIGEPMTIDLEATHVKP